MKLGALLIFPGTSLAFSQLPGFRVSRIYPYEQPA